MNTQLVVNPLRFDTLNWKAIERKLRKTQDREEDRQGRDQDRLFCAACRRLITRKHQRILVQGQHEHVFTNPHGITFRIGCFAAAPGCGQVGESTEEHTWFAGYRWQIAVCAGCGTHLGWRFASRSGDSFHGLILRHLIAENNNP